MLRLFRKRLIYDFNPDVNYLHTLNISEISLFLKKTTSKPLRGSLNSFRRCLAGVFLCLPIFRVFRAFNGSALSLLELACILFNTADVIHFGITHLAQL